ncbi:MAG: thioredoxin TrxA [Chlamydiales bacterium]
MADNIKHLTDDNFQETLSSEKVVLVDFHADWCGPCRMMAPVLQEFADEMNGKVAVGKLNIDSSQDTTQKFGVTSIPTIILFKNGVEVDRFVGVRGLEELKEMVDPVLSQA